MVAPYTVRIHPFSRVPSPGDRGYLLRVEGSGDCLFSQRPPGGPERVTLYGAAPKVLGLDVRAEGACEVVRITNPLEILIRPLSDQETRRLIAEPTEERRA